MSYRTMAISLLLERGPMTAWYIADALGGSLRGVNKALQTAYKHGQLDYVLVPCGAFHSFRKKSKLWFHPDNPPAEDRVEIPDLAGL